MKAKIIVLILLCGISSLIYSQSFKADIMKPDNAYNIAEEQYYMESFEGEAFPPADWHTWSFLGKQTWQKNGSLRFEGNRCAMLNYETQGTQKGEDWLVTPQFTVSSGDQFLFYIRPIYSGSKPDSLFVLISTLDAAPLPEDSAVFAAAFTDTLLAISVGDLNSEWHRYTESLSKYAGKKIYAAFIDKNKAGSGVYLDYVMFGKLPERDIMTEYANIKKAARINEPVLFDASFHNLGIAAQSFYVNCEIPETGYKNQTYYTAAPGESIYHQFEYWTPAAAGTYNVIIYSSLEGDVNTSSDTAVSEITVYETLPGSFWHSEIPLAAGNNLFGAVPYIKRSGSELIPDTTFIYTFAGQQNGYYPKEIAKYNVNSQKWSYAKAVFPYLLYTHNAVQVGGKAYIPGGKSNIGNFNLNYLHVYDIEKDTLYKKANMPLDCSYYAISSYGDSLIFVMGGYNYTYNTLNTIQIYNILTNSWLYGTPFPGEGKSGLSGSIVGNKIVLAGGSNASGPSSKVYIGDINPSDPYKITWKEDTFPGETTFEMTSGSWYGKDHSFVFFAGGQGRDIKGSLSYSSDFWAFDVETEKWFLGPEKWTGVESASDIVPVIRNDSLFMALLGGQGKFGYAVVNEWLYLGKPDPLTAAGIDAAVISAETDTVILGDKITPKAVFKNKQLTPQSFGTTMKITPGSYVSTAQAAAISHNAELELQYDEWTPDTAGIYTVKTYITLPGDENNSNDTLYTRIAVIDTSAIGVDEQNIMTPAVYSLSQNYPNPFNPSTVIKYSIPEAGQVELRVYNILGQEVITLVNEFMKAGQHEVKFNAGALNLSSGVYLYRIKSGSFVQTKKLMLIK